MPMLIINIMQLKQESSIIILKYEKEDFTLDTILVV